MIGFSRGVIFFAYRWALCFSFTLFFFVTNAHPLHLSVTNISITPTEASVVIKVFADDFSNVVSNYNNTPVNLIDSIEKHTQHITNYILSVFKVKYNNSNAQLEFNSHVLSDLSIILTYKIKIDGPLTSLFIENRLFYNWFSDQKNLLIVSNGSFEKGYEMTTDKVVQAIDL